MQTLFDSLTMNHFGAASHADPPSHLPSTSLNFDEETFLVDISLSLLAKERLKTILAQLFAKQVLYPW